MSFNRRDFLKGVGLLGLGTVSNTALADETLTLQNQELAFLSPPYLQNVQAGQITVCCIFNQPCFAWLEIIDDNQSVVKTIYQVEDGMRNANVDHYKFTVSNQENNFTYRVVAKEIKKFEAYKIEYGKTIQSESIKTNLPQKDQESINCLILNDIHENKDSYGLLYNKSTLATKDFVFINGDSFHYVTTVNDLTDKLLKPVTSSFAKNTPFLMVRGNHETRGSFAREFKRYFDYKDNKFYQAFKMGPIYWIVLDSGEDKPDTHEVYGGTVDYDNYRLEQKEWLEQILKSKERKSAKHTIVVTHIPFHHSDDWHGTIHNKECFHEILQKNKVDAVISGHTHKHGFFPPNSEHNYYVIIGGAPQEGKRTFTEISANGKSLSVKLMLENGETINSFTKNA